MLRYHKIKYKDSPTEWWVLELDNKNGKSSYSPEIIHYALKIFSQYDKPNIFNTLLWHDVNIRKFILLLNKWMIAFQEASIKGYYMNEVCGFIPKENVIVIETKQIPYQGNLSNIIEDGFKQIRQEQTDKKPRYLKWMNGTHWYCKVGKMDVLVDGEQKWNTREEAEKAYEKWKRQIKE